MIITKTQKIKVLENHIIELTSEINRKEKILISQFDAINLLTRKVENQCKEIKNLSKIIERMRNDK